MRPAGRRETDSLYFDYPVFDPPDAATCRLPNDRGSVAIVGAGPIGLTAALALAKEGVHSVVFDDKATFNDGSRAICIARPSMYILEALGAVAPFLDKALAWTTGRTFFRGRQILEFEMPHGPEDKYGPMYNLQQQYIEQYLWQAANASDFIEIRWQSRVAAVCDTDVGVAITVEDPAGRYDFESPWLLACDGARSSIRRLRGLRLQGENFEGRYVIADIRMDHDYPTMRRALFDPSSRPGGTVLIHKQPEDIWRIDYQLRDDEPTEDALREATVRASVTAVLKDIGFDGPWELEWWSVYSANTLALDDYRDGRIFFVGDSAHIVPIFGVRGLNNGLADAANIGWKLGWVLNGRAGVALLQSYTPERRGATLDVFANASKSARFMTPNSHGWKLMRDAALSLALSHPFAGQLANPRQMTAFTYRDSPIVRADDPAFTGGPCAGAVMPEVKLDSEFLSAKLGAGFTVLCFDSRLATEIAGAAPNDGFLRVVRLDKSSPAAQRFAAGERSAYLIRPDMHIAARWFEATAGAVIEGFVNATCSEEVQP